MHQKDANYADPGVLDGDLGQPVVIRNGKPVGVVGRARQAIYKFRKLAQLIAEGAPQTSQQYDVDDDLLKLLNDSNHAPVTDE